MLLNKIWKIYKGPIKSAVNSTQENQISGRILESKGMHGNFQKKRKKGQ